MRGCEMTDDQLKAECARRFAGPINEYTRLTEVYHQALVERDEWRARAEKAEAVLNSGKVLRIEADAGELVPLGSLHDF